MKLSRALELCQGPLDASRSQLVKVERYALTHVLRDRRENLERLAAKSNDYERLYAKAAKMEEEIERLKFVVNGLSQDVRDSANAAYDEMKNSTNAA